jgi:hypothetical protein
MSFFSLLGQELRWLFARKTLYLRWLVIGVIPFLFFATLYTVGGEAMRRSMDEEQPRVRIAFIEGENNADLKAALAKKSNYEILPDVAAKGWEKKIKPDSIFYVIEAKGDSSGLSSVFVWFDGEKIAGAARLKEQIYLFQQQANGVPSFRVESSDARSMSEKLNFIIQILLTTIASLLALFLVIFSVWSGRHVAIHAFIIRRLPSEGQAEATISTSRDGLHFSSFSAIWISTYMAVILMLTGIWAATKLNYTDDSAMILGMLSNFINVSFLLKILVNALPLTLLLAALWSKLNSSAGGSTYRAMRRGNATYVFIFVGIALAIILLLLRSPALIYIPIFNTFAIVSQLLNNQATSIDIAYFWLINLLPAFLLLFLSSRDGSKTQ